MENIKIPIYSLGSVKMQDKKTHKIYQIVNIWVNAKTHAISWLEGKRVKNGIIYGASFTLNEVELIVQEKSKNRVGISEGDFKCDLWRPIDDYPGDCEGCGHYLCRICGEREKEE